MKDEIPVSYGLLNHGLSLNSFIESVLSFVTDELVKWRSRPSRKQETAENRLNSQLCKHLNNAARKAWLPYTFHHEENQEGNRRVDISAGFVVERFLESTYYTEDDPFIVFECKRLPAPARVREREYVTSGSADKIMGGIQRFKLGLHGGRHRYAVMIGYVQGEKPSWWFSKINAWIAELVGSPQRYGESWASSDLLVDFHEQSAINACAQSRHIRTGPVLGEVIEIRHIWILMT